MDSQMNTDDAPASSPISVLSSAPGGPVAEEKQVDDVSLSLRYANGSALLSVIAPQGYARCPSDICLVIDISGSMDMEVTVRGSGDQVEQSALSQLDLVKHATKTIIHSLRPTDRLALVAFSDTAEVCLKWTAMDAAGQRAALQQVDQLHTKGSTNLYDGVIKGLSLFEEDTIDYRNGSIFLLTDGLPNINPPRGIVESLVLRQQKHLARCTINTFGFGYSLDSAVLEEIAVLGNGSFSFIPDASFVGTIFVNAIANLLTSVANDVRVSIEGRGVVVDKEFVKSHKLVRQPGGAINMQLDGIAFSQNKDFVIPIKLKKRRSQDKQPGSDAPAAPSLHVEVVYSSPHKAKTVTVNASVEIPLVEDADEPKDTADAQGGEGQQGQRGLSQEGANPIDHPDKDADMNEEVDKTTKAVKELSLASVAADPAFVCPLLAHRARLSAVNLIRDLIALKDDERREGTQIQQWLDSTRADLDTIRQIEEAAARGAEGAEGQAHDDDDDDDDDDVAKAEGEYTGRVSALIKDIDGQVREASTNAEYFSRWGVHYLRSLSRAHLYEVCNNFKDPGVQKYGGQLFKTIRDEMDEMFSNLPPPVPSNGSYHGGGGGGGFGSANMSMRSFNCASNGCFGGACVLTLASGAECAVSDVRAGDEVRTADGKSARVVHAIKLGCEGGSTSLVKLPGGLLITPFHPVRVDGEWQFPCDLVDAPVPRENCEPFQVACDYVYNFTLSVGHTLSVNGVDCCTLGHGLTGPVIEHEYFGSHRIVDDLESVANAQGKDGNICLEAGTYNWARDAQTGLINGLNWQAPQ